MLGQTQYTMQQHLNKWRFIITKNKVKLLNVAWKWWLFANCWLVANSSIWVCVNVFWASACEFKWFSLTCEWCVFFSLWFFSACHYQQIANINLILYEPHTPAYLLCFADFDGNTLMIILLSYLFGPLLWSDKIQLNMHNINTIVRSRSSSNIPIMIIVLLIKSQLNRVSFN